MTQYLYTNHRILREEKPTRPVVVVQGPEETREGNEFEFYYRGQPIGRIKFNNDGLEACETHHVRAWVEFDDDIDIRTVVKAAPKKPNKKVKT